jgi:hypothetical protein
MLGSIFWPKRLLEVEDLFKKFPNLDKMFFENTSSMSPERSF